MKALKVNFARQEGRWRAGLVLLLALGLSLAIALAYDALTVVRALDEMRGQSAPVLVDSDSGANGPGGVEQTSEQIPQEVPAPGSYPLEQARLKKLAAFEAYAVFAALESVRLPGVRVTSLSIDVEKYQVEVEIEAIELSAALKFVDLIRASGKRFDWRLNRTSLRSEAGVSASLSATRR